MQSIVDAFKLRLQDATIISGDPSADCIVHMECAHGYIDLRQRDGRVVCLLETGASLEIADDGSSMCLNSNVRSIEPFRKCNGFQEAVDALLACKNWYRAE